MPDAVHAPTRWGFRMTRPDWTTRAALLIIGVAFTFCVFVAIGALMDRVGFEYTIYLYHKLIDPLVGQ